MNYIINLWHKMMATPKYNLEWHEADITEELQEYNETKGFVNTWSELSDVVYTYTRAVWSSHKNIKYPLGKFSFYIGLLYMFPKYTLRWKFYNKLGKKFGKNISEVRNPKKVEKLEEIAKRHDIDPRQFIVEAEKLRKYWIFLK